MQTCCEAMAGVSGAGETRPCAECTILVGSYAFSPFLAPFYAGFI